MDGDELEDQLVSTVRRRNGQTVIIGSQLIIPTIYAALRRVHLRIPQDVSVLSLLDVPWMQAIDPQPATVRLDNEGLGQASAKVMLDWLAGRPPASEITHVAEAEWVERGSVGPAPDRGSTNGHRAGAGLSTRR